MVVGTTGFDAAQLEQVRAATRAVPLCMSSNFSTGVNLCLRLLDIAARLPDPKAAETPAKNPKGPRP